MTDFVMTRSRWTKPRLFDLGVMYGRGFDAEEIARELRSHSGCEAHPSAGSVREVCRRFGWAFADRPPGNLTVALPGKLLAALGDQAARRGLTAEALASKLLCPIAEDPVLLANVLDDDA